MRHRVQAQRPGASRRLPPGDGVLGAALVADGDLKSAEVAGFGVGDVADDAWRPDGGKDLAADRAR